MTDSTIPGTALQTRSSSTLEWKVWMLTTPNRPPLDLSENLRFVPCLILLTYFREPYVQLSFVENRSFLVTEVISTRAQK